jgi:hypothetical protein
MDGGPDDGVQKNIVEGRKRNGGAHKTLTHTHTELFENFTFSFLSIFCRVFEAHVSIRARSTSNWFMLRAGRRVSEKTSAGSFAARGRVPPEWAETKRFSSPFFFLQKKTKFSFLPFSPIPL